MDQDRFAYRAYLPDALTISRVLAAALLSVAVLMAGAPWLAAALVAFAAVTDFLDGMLARSRGRASKFGAVIDPIADKIFILTALLLLVADNLLRNIHVWAVLIILWRELAISALRDFSFPTPVTPLAKIKTAIQFSSVILLFASRVPGRNSEALFGLGAGLLWGAVILTLYTGADYILRAWRQSWK